MKFNVKILSKDGAVLYQGIHECNSRTEAFDIASEIGESIPTTPQQLFVEKRRRLPNKKKTVSVGWLLLGLIASVIIISILRMV